MVNISVVTPSIRKDRLKIVENCLDKQTFRDFEWVVSGLTDKPKDYTWAFNRAMNDCLGRSSGLLIVSIQDSIWFPPDALYKFWYHFSRNPNYCISGVGDQYESLDDNGKPSNKIWLDPRKRSDIGSFYECNPEDWELNFCSFPKEMIYDVGGFDEEMDKWYGMDNVAVAFRLDKLGAKFYLDQTNESFTLKHDRRKDWNEKHWMHNGFWEWFKKRSIKLDYLKR